MGESKKCPKCNALNLAAADVCSLCGESLTGGADRPSVPEGMTTARSSGGVGAAAVKGGAAGFGMGWLVAGAMFFVGLLLTLTGIGAIIGIPLMLGAVVVPFVLGGFWAAAGRRQAAQQVRGLCPYCGEDLIATGTGFDCPTCAQRVIHRGGHFMTLDRAEQDSAPSSP